MDNNATQETPDQLMARMTAKYGAPAAGPAPQQAPQPVQQPAAPQKKAVPQGGILNGAIEAIKGRKKQIDEAAGYSRGGKIKGPGTATSDSIPAQVEQTGEAIRVANGERIVSAEQDKFLEKVAKDAGFSSLDEYLEAGTGKPVGPTIKGGQVAAAGGASEDDLLKKASSMTYRDVQNKTEPVIPPAAPQSVNVDSGIGIGSGKPPTIYDKGGLPADVVRRGVETMRSQLAPAPATAAPTASPAAGKSPSIFDNLPPLFDPASKIGPSQKPVGIDAGVNAVGQMFKDSAEAARSGRHYSEIVADRKATEAAPAPAPAATGPASFAPTPERFPLPGNDAASFITGKATYSGFDKTGMAPPVAEPKPGRNANGVITADSAKAAMGDDMQRSGGIAGGIDMAGVNAIMARENQIRGELQDMKDAGSRLNSGTGAAILADSAGAEIDKLNAERTSRWAADDLRDSIKRAGTRTERAALGQALAATVAGQTQRDTEAIRQQGIAGGLQVQARGQDMQAQTEANRLAGSPTDQRLKGAQAEGIAAQTETTKALGDLQRKAIAGDPAALATLQAINGKNRSASDRFLTVQGGEEIGPDGMTKIKRPGGVFDAQTQRFVPMDGQQGGPKQAPAAALDYLKKNPSQAEAFKAKYGYLPEGF